MLFALEAIASVRCTECDVRTPMPGLRLALTCHNCAAPIDIVAKAKDARVGGIRYAFGAYYDAPAEAFLFGYDRTLKDNHESNGSPMTLKRKDPRCPACDAALPAPPSSGQPFLCSGCGDEIAVRAPDDVTRAWDPRLYCVIGDAFVRGSSLNEKRVEGSALSCGNCGAELTAQGRRRLIACTHCTSKNFITDDAWTKLFPRPGAHPFYLVYSVDDVAAGRHFHQGLARVASHYFFNAEERAIIERHGDRCNEDDSDL